MKSHVKPSRQPYYPGDAHLTNRAASRQSPCYTSTSILHPPNSKLQPPSTTTLPATPVAMTNFWDLPNAVRKRIYRLHLVTNEQPVDFEAYKKSCGNDRVRSSHTSQDRQFKPANRKIPLLLQVSRKVEREASPIYFGENTFGLWWLESLFVWKHFTWPRHINRIRKVLLLHWTPRTDAAGNAAFRKLSTLHRLESLTFIVDETQRLRNLLDPSRYDPKSVHRAIRWDDSLGFGPQISLQALRFNGIEGLRSLRGLREVEFRGRYGPDHGGPTPGGLLETTIKKEIMQPRGSRTAAQVGKFQAPCGSC
jgi:hypothetical protein